MRVIQMEKDRCNGKQDKNIQAILITMKDRVKGHTTLPTVENGQANGKMICKMDLAAIDSRKVNL